MAPPPPWIKAAGRPPLWPGTGGPWNCILSSAFCRLDTDTDIQIQTHSLTTAYHTLSTILRTHLGKILGVSSVISHLCRSARPCLLVLGLSAGIFGCVFIPILIHNQPSFVIRDFKFNVRDQSTSTRGRAFICEPVRPASEPHIPKLSASYIQAVVWSELKSKGRGLVIIGETYEGKRVSPVRGIAEGRGEREGKVKGRRIKRASKRKEKKREEKRNQTREKGKKETSSLLHCNTATLQHCTACVSRVSHDTRRSPRDPDSGPEGKRKDTREISPSYSPPIKSS